MKKTFWEPCNGDNVQYVLPVPFNHLKVRGISAVSMKGAVKTGYHKTSGTNDINSSSAWLNNESYFIHSSSTAQVL